MYIIDEELIDFMALAQQDTKARKVVSVPLTKSIEMAKYIDLSAFWTEDKNMTIEDAKRETGLDRRTLSAAKKGFLDRCQVETLFKLKELASRLAGRNVSFEEIFKDR